MKDIFRFHGLPDLYCDTNGNFFYKDRPARIVYNNGSRAVMYGKSKRGLISLRKIAYKDRIKEIEYPF